jgi:hypothetical protein
MEMDIFQDGQPPVGLTMGLAMDLAAMNRYAKLTEAEKEEILNRARDAKSRAEMKRIIEELR